MNKTLLLSAAVAWIAGVMALPGLVAPAFACGAQGGDNREPAASCATGGNAHPAVHASASPGGSTAFPVDIITGNKFLAQRDAWLPGGLSFVRFYNSRHQFKGPMGLGWRHAFHVSLTLRQRQSLPATAQIVQGDGRRIVFRPDSPAHAHRFRAVNWAYGALVREPELAPDRRFRWQWRDGSKLYFNQTGRLTAIEKVTGERLYLSYAGSPSRLHTVINRHQQVLRFEYSKGPERLLQVVHLPDGQQVRYHYDTHQVLSSVRRDESLQWAFQHADDHAGAITEVRNALGETTNHIRYGPQRRVVYAALGGDARAISLAYQIPRGSAESGETRISLEPKGVVARYTWRYDPVTQQRSLLNAQGDGCIVCPPTGTQKEYDTQGRLKKVRRSDGSRSLRQYDAQGRLVEYQWLRVSGRANRPEHRQINTTVQYQSDQAGALVRQLSRPSLAPGKTHRVSYTRDTLGRVVIIDETGYEPDLKTLQRSRSVWAVGRWKKLHRRWQIRYVDFGPAAGLISQIDGPLPGSVDLVRYVYDKRGRRVAQFGPYRRVQRWSYQVNGLIAAITSSNGASQSFSYDRFNRLVARTRDHIKTVIGRDAAGRRSSLKPSNRPGINLERDVNGVVVRLTDPNGNQLQLPADTENFTAVSPRHGGAVVPPELSPPVQAIATGFSRIYRAPGDQFRIDLKDDFGRLVAYLDSETGIHRTVFDLADRPIARIGDRELIELYKYDAAGRFAGMLASNRTTWSQRWQHGRLTGRSSSVEEVAYQYNQNRQLVQTSTSYADKVLDQKFETPLVLKRQYDDQGRLSHREIGHGWRLEYRWRKTHELDSLSLLGPASTSGPGKVVPLADKLIWQAFSDGQSGLLEARLGNGIKSRVSLGDSLRVKTIALERLPAKAQARRPLPTVSLSYGPRGRVTGQQVGDVRFDYQYDDRGWLTAYQSQLAKESWRYRRDGTREQAPVGGKPVFSKPHPVSLAGERKSDTVQTRTVLVRSPAGARVLLDRAGRPKYAATSEGRTYRYIYDVAGIRIGKLSIDRPESSRWFVYENKRLFIETDAAGTPSRVFVRLDDKPLAVIEFVAPGNDPLIHWVHTDAVGQPIATTGVSGAITWSGSFSPFGRFLPGAGSDQPPAWLPLRLAGQYFDAETGYHDNFRRTYDPSTGAYLGPDPLGIRPGSLRYAYAGNSPLDTIDPLGLYEMDMHYYATFAIALAAGMTYEDARTIANANQHVDDHVDTEPIVRREDGTRDLVETALRRAEVLRQWHFVLETPVHNADGTVSYQVSTDTRISNPTSPRLRTLRRWVDGADNRATQMFRLGAYSHAYMDTAAHRYPDNRPIPASVSVVGMDENIAVGHAPHFHYPDYTYNTCPEDFPGGELPSSDPDHNSGLQEWPNNETRTLTIQQDMYEIYREFSNSEARISWEQLEVVLAQFNAVHEQGDPNDPGAADFPEKLALLEELLAGAGISSTTSRGPIVFVGREDTVANSAYDFDQAAGQWAERYSDPVENAIE